MHISNKKQVQQKTGTGKQYGKPVPVDWKLFTIDIQAILPYGKYVGKTVEYVRAQDENYWSWLVDKDLLGQWGLVKSRELQKPKTFTADDSSRWICLVEYNRTTIPAPEFWYE